MASRVLELKTSKYDSYKGWRTGKSESNYMAVFLSPNRTCLSVTNSPWGVLPYISEVAMSLALYELKELTK